MIYKADTSGPLLILFWLIIVEYLSVTYSVSTRCFPMIFDFW